MESVLSINEREINKNGRAYRQDSRKRGVYTLEYTKELCETASGFNCRHLLEAKEDGRKQP